jgi:phage gpG-like protein
MNNEARKLIKFKNDMIKNHSSFIKIMGNESLKHFNKSFVDSGFTDESFERWAARKPRSRNNNKLLIDTGRLKNSIRIMNMTNMSVTIGTSVFYAEYHNNGTSRIPKRKFIGFSSKLNKIIIEKVSNLVEKIFKNSATGII